jgi:hypothetical protein
MTGRPYRHDRAIREPQWLIRILTIVILVAGAGVVVYLLNRPEARRERAVSELAVGDTTARIVEQLGASPTRCTGASLAHLKGRFPPGWSAAAQERAIEWLEEQTTERWVYPLETGRRVSCAETEAVTDLGIGDDGRLLWIVPVVGRQPLQLPETLEPGAFTEIPDV